MSSAQKLLTNLNCGRCSNPCNLGCARCGFRYCSYDCQRLDWPIHRKECTALIFQKKGLTLPKHISYGSRLLQNIDSNENDTESVKSFNTNNKSSRGRRKLRSPKPIHLSCESNQNVIPIESKTIGKVPEAKLNTNPKRNTVISPIAITSFIRSNCVYIRNADDDTTKRYKMIHHVVEQLSKNLTPIERIPEEGTFLIVNLNGFKRCTTQSVKEKNAVKVFLSDFGQQEVVQMNRLFEPGKRLEKLAETSFIRMLKLENVPEFYLNYKASEYVKSLLDDKLYLELHPGANADEGRIFDVGRNEFVNDVLFCYEQETQEDTVEFEPGEKEYTFVEEPFIKIQDIASRELPLEREVNLMIYDTSQLRKGYIISCVNIEDLGDIKEAIQYFNDYGSKNQDKIIRPDADDLCIAFYAKKKKWCRGRFFEVNEENPNEGIICFIDFGKRCSVPFDKMIKFPHAFSYIPNYLYICRVFGLPQNPSEELCDRLHELLPENSITKAKPLSAVDTNFALIEVEAIIKILALEDLI